MNILSSFSEISNKTKFAFKRFPITLLWAILGSFFTIWFIDQKIETEISFKYAKIIISFALGISWLIATRVLISYFKEEKKQNRSWLIVFPLIFLAAYYYFLPNDSSQFKDNTVLYRFVLYLVTGHLIIFFSPFLFAWDKNAYWNYLKNIFSAITTSVFFSLVIYLGLVIAILSLKYLFKIEIRDRLFLQLFVFCLGIINTWLFLAHIVKNPLNNKTLDYPKGLEVFVKYILIPLTILYLIILYAYSIKILIQWNLPKGWVSYLVTGLSILGFVIHILINPIRKTINSKLIKNFYPWFYYALLPMIALLFIAIFKRVTDYGFTENRYLVLLLAFWILGMTIYILFSKRKKLKYFPMSVALLTILVSFGFWGVFEVSKSSQVKQFNKLYNTMKAKDFKVTDKEDRMLESILHFLSKRKQLNQLEPTLGYNPYARFKDLHDWDIDYRIKDSLDIEIVDFVEPNIRNRFKYYNLKYNELIVVKGYDYFKTVHFDNNIYEGGKITRPPNLREDDNKIRQYSFHLDSLSTFYVVNQKDTIHSFSLLPIISKIANLSYDKSYDLEQELLTIEKDFTELKLKIIFQGIDTRKINDTIQISNAHGMIFIKEKEKTD